MYRERLEVEQMDKLRKLFKSWPKGTTPKGRYKLSFKELKKPLYNDIYILIGTKKEKLIHEFLEEQENELYKKWRCEECMEFKADEYWDEYSGFCKECTEERAIHYSFD